MDFFQMAQQTNFNHDTPKQDKRGIRVRDLDPVRFFFVWFVVFVVNWFSFSFWLLAIPLGPFFAKIPESQSNGPATYPV